MKKCLLEIDNENIYYQNSNSFKSLKQNFLIFIYKIRDNSDNYLNVKN